MIAYRGPYRWTRGFVPAPLPTRAPPVRPGSVYLIAGGTGGMGAALAHWLAQSAPGVRLALLARSPCPDDLCRRLRDLGAQVLAVQADLADPAALAAALARVQEQLGPIRGVIHAAGIADGDLIRFRTREDCDRCLTAKVDGTLILDRALADAPLDFFVLCSSLTATLGGAGQAAYAAACAFQNAYAHARAARGAAGLSLAIGWDRWNGLGMAAAAALYRERTGDDLAPGLGVDEGTAAFGRLLGAAESGDVLVSVRDFPARLRHSRAFQLDATAMRSAPVAGHGRPDLEVA